MIIILLLFLLLVLLYFNYENFTNDDINYKVIHIRSNKERYNNILNNQNKLRQEIKLFDAVIGSQVDLSNLIIYDSNFQNNFRHTHINEIGCYLSHFTLLKSINKTTGYTVVFEDDFVIVHDNLHDKIKDIISKVDDFDLIYLGNLNNNKGNNYKDDIYTIDPANFLWGTHAYIINNKNAKKIYNKLLNMELAIDNQYKRLIDNKELNAYVINPPLVNQLGTLKSTIR